MTFLYMLYGISVVKDFYSSMLIENESLLSFNSQQYYYVLRFFYLLQTTILMQEKSVKNREHNMKTR